MNFVGNLHDELSIVLMPDYVEYNPEKMPALVGLHGACYTVMFRLGEYFVFCVA